VDPIPSSWHGVSKSFDYNVASVFQLVDFDHVIIDFAVDGLRMLARDLEDRGVNTAVMMVTNRAAMLENVKNADSLRPQYEQMFNQCVVLLVSYFGSAIHRIFREGVIAALKTEALVPVTDEELRVSWRGLERADGEREAIFADVLVAQKDISFQDMQSISRAFRELLDVSVERNAHTDNIILGQAARHAIVHASSVVDARMIHQLRSAQTRTLKPKLTARQAIRFQPTEVRELASSMQAYITSLCDALSSKLTPNPN
jgi:hypothetical protein